MQERPDDATTLLGLAGFLAGEVRPALGDKGLRFRALIAAHLAKSVAMSIATADQRRRQALTALAALLERDVPGPDATEEKEALRAWQEELSTGLRSDTLAVDLDALRDVLMAGLASDIRIANDRFDLKDTLE